ncbi:hypothetical protein H6F75_13070 [Nodosilinea sp. FACHB-131]|uniref:hypothetical protein n=1 Tax=Cyanophyceae TaxID=3028117 RepID=UPI001687B444|nr:hypothetical protein [Nodosilinea sp. FACHB-131]MBD1874418.1 hypothetical protein [Nodosilinea sp. FACHB-131]
MNSLFYSLSTLLSFAKTTVGKARLGRRVALAALAIALWLGSVSLYVPSAQAANAPRTGAGDTSAVRPSHNPISNENFQGGVDLTALDRQGKNVQPPAKSKVGIVERLKNLLSGSSSEKSSANVPRSNVQPERNPTLDRYPN